MENEQKGNEFRDALLELCSDFGFEGVAVLVVGKSEELKGDADKIGFPVLVSGGAVTHASNNAKAMIKNAVVSLRVIAKLTADEQKGVLAEMSN